MSDGGGEAMSLHAGHPEDGQAATSHDIRGAQPTAPSPSETVEGADPVREMMAEVARLRDEVAELRTQLAASSAGPADATVGSEVAANGGAHLPDSAGLTAPRPDESPAAAAPGPRWSRRGMLLGALGAAAGATAAVAGATPAAAITGPMRYGGGNDSGADSTSLWSSHDQQVLHVQNYGQGSAIWAVAGGTWSAIRAQASSGAGVYASSSDGPGLHASTTNLGPGLQSFAWFGPAAILRSTAGPTMRLDGGLSSVPMSGEWQAGDVVAVKTDGGSRMELWACVISGTPGVWRQLAGPSIAGGYVAVKPIRVFDSRWSGVPGVTTGPLLPGTMRTVSVADARDSRGGVIRAGVIPRGTTAVTLNLTVVDTVGRGNLAVVPDGGSGSETSSINWSADNQVLANGLTVGIMPDRRTVDVLCRSNRTNLVIDITGYYSGA